MSPEQLRSLARAMDGLDAASAVHLRRAADGAEAPVRWVVIGRVGAGKTTLVNAWTGAREATGLGGVTREPQQHAVAADPAVELWDTPGIDDPDTAIVRLGHLLSAADGLIWVVDGLQPLTASERRVVDELVDAPVPRHLFVSRADLLEPDDAEAVAARVASLVGVTPSLHDLRQEDAPQPALPPSPARAEHIRAAVRQAREALDDAAVPTLATLRLRFRQAIRAEVERIEGRIDEGRVRDKNEALVALNRAVGAVVDATFEGVDGPRPPLPGPARAGERLMQQVLDRFSGQEGAHRILKAEAARWLMEGQMALEDWWADRDDLQALAAEVAAARALLPPAPG